jgi:hypothetical protein
MIERRNEMKEATVFRNLLCAGLIFLLLGIGVADLQAQEAAGQAHEAEDLAKKTQNPVSDLISLPFQNNFNFGAGPDDEMQYILNIQPVYPMRLTEDWNLIHRTILPVIANPSGLGGETGLGDLQYQGFFRLRNRAGSSGVLGRSLGFRQPQTTPWATAGGR